MASQAPAKNIAILCAGLDRVLRGYESHTRRLFDAVHQEQRPGYRFTLVKRAGAKAPEEIRLRTPFRRTWICQLLGRLRGGPVYWEALLFAFAFVARCFFLRKRYDVLITIEPFVSVVMMRFRKLIPGRPKVVMTHTVTNTPEQNISRADVFHEVNIENYEAITAYIRLHNLKDKSAHLIPHFINAGEIRVDASQEELKKQFGITTKYALLAVGVVTRYIKRTEYVISEAAKLGNDWTLVLCGRVDEPDLVEEAKRLMGDRVITLTLPLARMPELYKVSDVFVFASLWEGFGIVNVEAMSMGVPVVVHDRKLFRWIVKDDTCAIDLTQKGALCAWVKERENISGWFEQKGNANRKLAEEHYSWEAVKESYYKMY
jgi:glycosyltransferase involved in cell wall biosynthesis